MSKRVKITNAIMVYLILTVGILSLPLALWGGIRYIFELYEPGWFAGLAELLAFLFGGILAVVCLPEGIPGLIHIIKKSYLKKRGAFLFDVIYQIVLLTNLLLLYLGLIFEEMPMGSIDSEGILDCLTGILVIGPLIGLLIWNMVTYLRREV